MADDGTDDRDDEPTEEQDVLVVLPLSNRQMGTARERAELEAFADQLAEAVEGAGVGEYDGDEYGGGEYTMFFCGPDAERLFATLQPLLKRSPLCRGGKVVRQTTAADGTPDRVTIRL